MRGQSKGTVLAWEESWSKTVRKLHSCNGQWQQCQGSSRSQGPDATQETRPGCNVHLTQNLRRSPMGSCTAWQNDF